MDISLQAKLLRVLQEKEIERIGGQAPVAINTRIIATSNRDILNAVSQGTFRQDLYYRLYVLHIEVPPLRERPKDVPLLAEHFFLINLKQALIDPILFTEEAMKKMTQHVWPGNVRELQNIIQRSILTCDNDQILPKNILIEGDTPMLTLEWVESLPIGQSLRIVETQFILGTLKHHQGNRTHAAKHLV